MSSFKDSYLENGFSVSRGIIETSLIDEVLEELSNVKRNANIEYHSMASQKLEKIELDKSGYLVHPIGDIAISDYINPLLSNLASLTRGIMSQKTILNSLSQIHGSLQYNCVMSMLFDSNAEHLLIRMIII